MVASTVKSSETGKKEEINLATGKGYIGKENDEERETYKSGAFWNNLGEFIFEEGTV